jgi:hypothetical protein
MQPIPLMCVLCPCFCPCRHAFPVHPYPVPHRVQHLEVVAHGGRRTVSVAAGPHTHTSSSNTQHAWRRQQQQQQQQQWVQPLGGCSGYSQCMVVAAAAAPDAAAGWQLRQHQQRNGGQQLCGNSTSSGYSGVCSGFQPSCPHPAASSMSGANSMPGASSSSSGLATGAAQAAAVGTAAGAAAGSVHAQGPCFVFSTAATSMPGVSSSSSSSGSSC